jgi:hypothetical protein
VAAGSTAGGAGSPAAGSGGGGAGGGVVLGGGDRTRWAACAPDRGTGDAGAPVDPAPGDGASDDGWEAWAWAGDVDRAGDAQRADGSVRGGLVGREPGLEPGRWRCLGPVEADGAMG